MTMLYLPSTKTDERIDELALEVHTLRLTLKQAVGLIADYEAMMHKYDRKRARRVLAAARDILAWTGGGL